MVNKKAIPFAMGIIFTFIVAVAGYLLAALPGLHLLGPLACAIILAIIYRQIAGYPEKIRSGVQFSSQKLLRFAIILFGLKLNIDTVLHQGLGLLARDILTILFSIGLTLLIAKWLKADMQLALLLGIGTGVCGAAAIAAVSPILKAKEEDSAIGAGIIALVGTIFAVGYTVLLQFLPISATQYGIWSGVSLHEIAHVALAAEPAGKDALAIALLAKLGRVLLLVPLSFILVYWMKRREKQSGGMQTKVSFPWFLLGFIAMSLFGSYVLGNYIHLSNQLLAFISFLTSFLLTMAMTGLGLNVHLKGLKEKALRPLLAMGITSILLAVATYFSI